MVPQKADVQVPASIDILTGIMNWWSFDELFEQEWVRARRERLPLSLIFFALEDFKTFNDTYGYLTGDECLQKIAQAAQETFSQPGQVVARYRGAEFVVLLVGTGTGAAKPMADNLHQTIEALDLGPTVAVGVATTSPHEGASLARPFSLRQKTRLPVVSRRARSRLVELQRALPGLNQLIAKKKMHGGDGPLVCLLSLDRRTPTSQGWDGALLNESHCSPGPHPTSAFSDQSSLLSG